MFEICGGTRAVTAMVVILLVGPAGACGDDYTTSDSATVGSTGGDAESLICANPKFVTGGAAGVLYGCEGAIEVGSVQYTLRTHYNGWEDTESVPIAGEDLAEPTGGGCAEPVKACCDEDVEEVGTSGASAEIELACHSDCAHRACLKALSELGELRFTTTLPALCNTGSCEDNLKLSWNHFYAFLTDHFDECVAYVLGGTEFNFGDPPCGEEMGCLRQAKLSIDCQIDPVDVEAVEKGGLCSQAPNQPPPRLEPECSLRAGTVHVSDAAGDAELDILRGAVKYSNFYCETEACPFVIQQLDVSIDDFTHAGKLVHDIVVSLHTPAIGHSAGGTNVTFVPGSIRIDVSAQFTDSVGTYNFSGTTSNLGTAAGQLAGEQFILADLSFQAGGYSFEIALESDDCEAELPYCWEELSLAPYNVVPEWIKVSPDDDDVLYVGHANGVLVSEMGGVGWDVFSTTPGVGPNEFVFDPQDPSMIYMGIGSEVWVYDAGVFSYHEDVPYLIRSIYVSPGDGSIYVTVQTPLASAAAAVYKQVAGVGNFTTNTIDATEYEDPIEAINLGLLDPYSPTLIGWALTEDVENDVLYFGGEINPTPGTPGHLYPPGQDPSEVGYWAPNVRSLDGGLTWENMNGGVVSWHMTRLAVDPLTSRVYGLEEGGQLMTSDSLGICWDVASENLAAPSFVLDPNDNTRILIGPWNDGVYASRDRGAHFAAAGLQGKHAPVIALNSTSTRIYATGAYYSTPTSLVSDGVWATVPCP